jgi:lysophospholipase L1-like esterase
MRFVDLTASYASKDESMHIYHPRYTLYLLLALLLAGCAEDVPRLTPLSQNAVILAFGDSLTYGTGAGAGNSYPAVLERLSGHRVINAGKPGEQTPAGLARLVRELDDYQPELLILCHGGNDMLRQQPLQGMAANLEQMVRLAHERGVQVVMLGVPRPALLTRSTADTYRSVAEKMGVPLEDAILAEVLSDNALKSDQIHPNAEGYRRIAEAVYRLLQKAGAL